MLKNWTPPTREIPLLCLPILSSGSVESGWAATEDLGALVSEDFCRTWAHGPAGQSDRELADALDCLVSGFGGLIQACQGRVGIVNKDAVDDYVTEIDWGIEALIKRWIRRFRPEDRWVGEESDPDPFDWHATTWFVDPIDGTRNLIDGNPNVTVHIGIIREGIPVISVVGFPFYNRVIVRVYDDSHQHILGQDPSHLVTEFRSNTGVEAQVAASLSDRLGCPVSRTRSIGKSALTLLETSRVFYKPKAKLWDVIAPLAILQIDVGHFYDISITLCGESGTAVTQPLFGFGRQFSQHISKRLSINARVGLVTVVPKSRIAIRGQIIQEVAACMSLSC